MFLFSKVSGYQMPICDNGLIIHCCFVVTLAFAAGALMKFFCLNIFYITLHFFSNALLQKIFLSHCFICLLLLDLQLVVKMLLLYCIFLWSVTHSSVLIHRDHNKEWGKALTYFVHHKHAQHISLGCAPSRSLNLSRLLEWPALLCFLLEMLTFTVKSSLEK